MPMGQNNLNLKYFAWKKYGFVPNPVGDHVFLISTIGFGRYLIYDCSGVFYTCIDTIVQPIYQNLKKSKKKRKKEISS